jgi:hypothetical protein
MKRTVEDFSKPKIIITFNPKTGKRMKILTQAEYKNDRK